MMEQKYGRVIFTRRSPERPAISAGELRIGQGRHARLMNVLAIEGRKNNIYVNSISPGALTRMTSGLGIDESLMNRLNPAFVSPAVAWLASERCDVTGCIFTAAGAASAGSTMSRRWACSSTSRSRSRSRCSTRPSRRSTTSRPRSRRRPEPMAACRALRVAEG